MTVGRVTPAWNPLAGNPLRTRAEVAEACRALVSPLAAHTSPGGARVTLGSSGAVFSREAEQLEGFARPLWGLASLAAGGGEFDGWRRFHDGLVNGTDPDHPEHWGRAGHFDQRIVEMAAIGFALLLAPDLLWEPLTGEQRARVAAWLAAVDDVEPVPNNWHFFRIVVDLARRSLGLDVDERALAASFDVVDRCYVGDGWYADGEGGLVDHYVPWAFHTYGLIYASSPHADPDRATELRARARAFAPQFAAWFAPDGAALPYGRSLTYRFAQSAFWGALALAGEEALPWSQVKALWLGNLRWWTQWPIAERDGVLSIGYAYANLRMAEGYNSPCSPYWAMKAFLPLALADGHPFWTADEEPPEVDPIVEQPHTSMVLARDDDHVVALCGQSLPVTTHSSIRLPAKYTKFAYSTRFAFSVPADDPTEPTDSMLLVAPVGEAPRSRFDATEVVVENGAVELSWRPCEGVEIRTRLAAGTPWHLRIHHITTDRTVRAVETGFALGYDGFDFGGPPLDGEQAEGRCVARSDRGVSAIVDLSGERQGRLELPSPNTNLVEPQTMLPTLVATLGPGRHTLRCGVLASSRRDTSTELPLTVEMPS